jgi:hypothetical protein
VVERVRAGKGAMAMQGPVMVLIGLMLFTWVIAIWATFESESQDEPEKESEKLESDRIDRPKAA